MDEFQVDGKRYRVVVHSFGDEGGKRPALVRDIEKIVRAEIAMWGPPEFDSYTFLFHFAADDHSGDGMEHLNSTQIIEPGALGEDGVYCKHTGNSRSRVFSRLECEETAADRVWSMGFYAPGQHAQSLGCRRYHKLLRSPDDASSRESGTRRSFFARESQTITGIENAPGTALTSAEASSLLAPFIDRRAACPKDEPAEHRH